jgi:hypothetical protein
MGTMNHLSASKKEVPINEGNCIFCGHTFVEDLSVSHSSYDYRCSTCNVTVRVSDRLYLNQTWPKYKEVTLHRKVLKRLQTNKGDFLNLYEDTFTFE